MKNFLPLLLITFTFFTQNELHSQTKDWTLLLYVVGTDIVEDALTDIEEMKAAGNTDNIHIVGMLGGATISGWETPSVSTFVDGQEIPQPYTPSDNFMVSTTNLTEFINYGVENYPADKYMLLFYNHGMAMRGWGWANTTDTQFKINDLKAGIENSDFIQDGNKFEVLGFDACLMACLEAQSALQDVAKYYIGSEETEPWHAWHWTPIITAMNTQADLDGVGLGEIIVDTYIEHSTDKNSHHVTLSVVDLAKISSLENAVEGLLTSLNDDDYLASFMKARSKSEEYSKSVSKPENSEDMVDIGDLVRHLKELEPGIETQANAVLDKLDEAVIYEKSDNTRPQATGISMYVPMNLLSDEDNLNDLIDNDYSPIEFSSTIKNFVTTDYLNYALADNEPVEGELDNSLGLVTGGSTLGELYSAIKLSEDHVEDLHQLQIILLEEITGIPDEFLLLGSTHPDTIVQKPDGSVIYGYQWDEEWLSLNGIPAYVADIQDFDVKDDNGNILYSFTKLHIPAILNPNTAEEKNIMFSYVVDEDFNYSLEGILRESYESDGGNLVTTKERIELQPGDQIQLIYEVFDVETNEAFFTPNASAVIDIQNGNSDLVLGHAHLEAGKYHVGFVLLDHSHNDTIIYDPMVREVMAMNNNEVLFAEEFGISVYPNPSSDLINIEFGEPLDAEIELLNNSGQILARTEIRNDQNTQIRLNDLASGVYFITIYANGKIFQKEIIKQ